MDSEANKSKIKVRTISLPKAISVRALSELLKVSGVDVIKQLMRNGILVNINQVIEYETAANVCKAFGCLPKQETVAAKKSASAERRSAAQTDKNWSNLPFRPPVVTIMGHVDHGKTRLLDAIRQANVAEGEVGGITQHIGAYQVEINGQKITFLDTPGHEAFTSMRARGARATDITILVVAADDGVMPQTIEAIDHAKAAGVPILVAINKIDKEEANADLVKQQLSAHGVVIEEWGGDTIAVGTSAKSGIGISELLENLLLLAEMEDLRANRDIPAKGVVIEARMDKTMGPVATVLVQSGTLKVGDFVAIESTYGKVKAMFNENGKRLRKAEPSTPVAILGLNGVPVVGDTLTTHANEKTAKELAISKALEVQKAQRENISLVNLFEQISKGELKEISVVLKTDVQGSIEPIVNSLNDLSNENVSVHIIRAAVGNISESDVMLASASKAVLVGFGVHVESGAQSMADAENIELRTYNIIYKLIEDVEKAMKGLLEPEYVDEIQGHAEVRAVFPSGRGKAAGCLVKDGKVMRKHKVKIYRGKEQTATSEIAALKRFKDDVNEVVAGLECGITLSSFQDFAPGDLFEFYVVKKS